jgi:hypothetical protein
MSNAACQQKGRYQMAKWIDIVKVWIPIPIIDRKDWVKYLVLVNWHAKELGNVIKQVPDAAFSKFLDSQVEAYLDGKQPPTEIQSAVMNIADDYMSGREVTVRAGDYIALQNHFRSVRK